MSKAPLLLFISPPRPSALQGGPYFEILSASGRTPASQWRLSGVNKVCPTCLGLLDQLLLRLCEGQDPPPCPPRVLHLGCTACYRGARLTLTLSVGYGGAACLLRLLTSLLFSPSTTNNSTPHRAVLLRDVLVDRMMLP